MKNIHRWILLIPVIGFAVMVWQTFIADKNPLFPLEEGNQDNKLLATFLMTYFVIVNLPFVIILSFVFAFKSPDK